MKTPAFVLAVSLALGGCVAGPGGANNAANRTLAGAAVGAAIGGLAGNAVGSDTMTGVVTGAVAGGALGALVNPNHVFRRDTRGYCYLVDEQGQPVFDAQGNVIYDYSRRC